MELCKIHKKEILGVLEVTIGQDGDLSDPLEVPACSECLDRVNEYILQNKGTQADPEKTVCPPVPHPHKRGANRDDPGAGPPVC